MTVTDVDVAGFDDSSTQVDAIQWRRLKVLEYRAKGFTLDEIVDILKAGHADIKISHGTVVSDLKAIKEAARDKIKEYVSEILPLEFEQGLASLQSIAKEAWLIAAATHDDRIKIAALNLAMAAGAQRLELLSDATIIDNALDFVQRANTKVAELTQEQKAGGPTGHKAAMADNLADDTV